MLLAFSQWWGVSGRQMFAPRRKYERCCAAGDGFRNGVRRVEWNAWTGACVFYQGESTPTLRPVSMLAACNPRECRWKPIYGRPGEKRLKRCKASERRAQSASPMVVAAGPCQRCCCTCSSGPRRLPGELVVCRWAGRRDRCRSGSRDESVKVLPEKAGASVAGSARARRKS